MLVSHWVDAHQSAEEVVAGLRVEVAARRPGAVGRVDLLDEVLGEDVVVVAAMDEDAPMRAKSQWSLALRCWTLGQGPARRNSESVGNP